MYSLYTWSTCLELQRIPEDYDCSRSRYLIDQRSYFRCRFLDDDEQNGGDEYGNKNKDGGCDDCDDHGLSVCDRVYSRTERVTTIIDLLGSS